MITVHLLYTFCTVKTIFALLYHLLDTWYTLKPTCAHIFYRKAILWTENLSFTFFLCCRMHFAPVWVVWSCIFSLSSSEFPYTVHWNWPPLYWQPSNYWTKIAKIAKKLHKSPLPTSHDLLSQSQHALSNLRPQKVIGSELTPAALKLVPSRRCGVQVVPRECCW